MWHEDDLQAVTLGQYESMKRTADAVIREREKGGTR
jgi:hypothetical protein